MRQDQHNSGPKDSYSLPGWQLPRQENGYFNSFWGKVYQVCAVTDGYIIRCPPSIKASISVLNSSPAYELSLVSSLRKMLHCLKTFALTTLANAGPFITKRNDFATSYERVTSLRRSPLSRKWLTSVRDRYACSIATRHSSIYFAFLVLVCSN